MTVDPNSRRAEARDLGVVVVPFHVHSLPAGPAGGDAVPPAPIGLRSSSHGADRRALATLWRPILCLCLALIGIALWKVLR